MVWQVKFYVIMLSCIALLCAFGTAAHAADYTVYDGNPSSSNIQYYKDILSKIPLGDNYVAFRSGQNDYTMVTGDISFTGGTFYSDNSCTVYTMQSGSNYNGYINYSKSTINNFYLDPENKIVYSDLGHYPDLEERGNKYEILTSLLCVCVIVGYVCRNIFYYRPR